MYNIFVVGKKSAALEAVAEALRKGRGLAVVHVESGEEALLLVEGNRVDGVIVSEFLLDGLAVSFVKELMKKHPLINCALISSLPPGKFHAMTEGLGLFMQLPIKPGVKAINAMIRRLDSINVLLNQATEGAGKA